MKHIILLASSIIAAASFAAPSVSYQTATNIAAVVVTNNVAPWAMKGQPQPGGSITDVKTNGVSAVVGGVANIVLTGGGGGADTNAVNDIIRSYDTTNLTVRIAARPTTNEVDAILASSNLCTVAAAQQMTNAVMTDVQANFFPISGSENAEINVKSITFSNDGGTLKGGLGQLNVSTSLQVGGGSRPMSLLIGEWQSLRNGWNRHTLPEWISSQAVTNGGAKAYANATFRTKTDNVCHKSQRCVSEFSFSGGAAGMTGLSITNNGSYISCSWMLFKDGRQVAQENSGTPDDLIVRFYSYEKTLFDSDPIATRHEYAVATSGQPFVTADNVPSTNGFVTANITNGFVTASITNGLAPRLTGVTYDFAHGSNFTLRLYATLTNLIDRLGGAITNAPAFN